MNFLLCAASVDKDVFYFHVCHQARQAWWWWWCLGVPAGMQGLSSSGISWGILFCKNAVDVEMNFLNEETDPFPRTGSVPGCNTKVIWLQIMESIASFLGVHDLAVQHSLWVGVMSHWPLLIQDCPGVMQGASSWPVSLLFLPGFLCSDCSCSQSLLDHNCILCFAIPYAYFPPGFYF